MRLNPFSKTRLIPYRVRNENKLNWSLGVSPPGWNRDASRAYRIKVVGDRPSPEDLVRLEELNAEGEAVLFGFSNCMDAAVFLEELSEELMLARNAAGRSWPDGR